MDHNVPTRPDVKNWSETKWLGSWNADAGVGLYLHAGRFRHDIELWWAQTVVYLPGGKVAVDRSWGRNGDEHAVRTGVFELLVEEPAKLITSSFHGAMDVTTPRELTAHPRGSGGNSVAVRWNLEAEAVRAPWSIYDQLETKQDWADGGHTEQHHLVRGEITVGADKFRLDGPGFDDHSHGVRQWDGFGSHIFFNVSFDDFGLHLIAVQTPTGAPAQMIGAVTRDGAAPDPITEVTTPLMADLLGAPPQLRASLKTRSGQQLDVDIDVLHTFPMTITETDNDNINGLDWDVEGDPLFFTECIARYTTADGHCGFGHLERSSRRRRIDRSSLLVRDPWTLMPGGEIYKHANERSHADV